LGFEHEGQKMRGRFTEEDGDVALSISELFTAKCCERLRRRSSLGTQRPMS